MINRFNFFDIYGYLLPGSFLLVLLWLPFGVMSGKWPSDLASAILGLGMAYIAGHLLRMWSEVIVKSSFKDDRDNVRKPSDLILDNDGDESLPNGCQFGNKIKKDLEKQFLRMFDGLDVSVEKSLAENLATAQKEIEQKKKEGKKPELTGEPKNARQIQINRNAAFFKCRAYLIQKKAPGAEQLQGMYELLRGMAAALFLAFALYAGLAIGLTIYGSPNWLVETLTKLPTRLQAMQVSVALCIFILACLEVVMAIASFWPGVTEGARRAAFYVLMCILLISGAVLGNTNGLMVSQKLGAYLNGHEASFVLMIATIVLALSLFCGSASRAFAATWVATVYREFSLVAQIPQPGTASGSVSKEQSDE